MFILKIIKEILYKPINGKMYGSKTANYIKIVPNPKYRACESMMV